MDHKKSPNRRSKRQSKLAEDSYWDCSVCTYRNTAEAFKCLMCDVRKGTSTRKPRINPQMVAQVAQQYTHSVPKVKKEGVIIPTHSTKLESMGLGGSSVKMEKEKKTAAASNDSGGGGKTTRKARPRLKNVDRSSAEHKAVTVNNVTVIITEFQPKRHHHQSSSSSVASDLNHHSSNHPVANAATTNGCNSSSIENGNHSDSTNLSCDSHADGRSS